MNRYLKEEANTITGARQANYKQHELREMRHYDAELRKEDIDKLSVQQRIARLDSMFGEDQGAQRERARLLIKQLPTIKKGKK